MYIKNNKEQVGNKVKIIEELESLFFINNKMPMRIAQNLIEQSAYWHKHTCGHPVHAPKHFERLENGSFGWEISFGANTFYVEKAVKQLVKKLSERQTNKKYIDRKKFRDIIRKSLSDNVSNFSGVFYDEYFIDDKGYMIFGAQAINVNEFIKVIEDYLTKSVNISEKPVSICEQYNRPDFPDCMIDNMVSIKNITGRVIKVIRSGKVLVLVDNETGKERYFDTDALRKIC